MNNEVLDILGLYYDSLEQRLLEEGKEPKTINVLVNAELASVSHREFSVNYSYTFQTGTNIVAQTTGRYGGFNFPAFINESYPNFFNQIGDKDDYNNIPISLQDCFKTACNGRTMTLYSKDINNLFEAILTDYLGSLGHLPTQYSLSLSITRCTNAEHIKRYCAHERGTKFNIWSRDNYTTKELVDYMLNTKSSSYNGYGSRIRSYNFDGRFQAELYRLPRESIVFAIEYLYGTLLNKTSSLNEIGRWLASAPINDFGFGDVQQIAQVCNCCSGRSKRVITLYNELVKVIPAKTSLQRWQKVLQPKAAA